MTVIKALILGIVQGLTEFLPISSSGHLSVFQYLMGVSNENSLLFDVMLHLGTLLAVCIVFYKTIFGLFKSLFLLIKDIFIGKFRFKDMKGYRHMLVMMFFSCIPLLVLVLPIGKGMKIMDVCASFTNDGNLWVEMFGFLFSALILLYGNYVSTKKPMNRRVNKKDAFSIGIIQLFSAAFPGISRSGSTISTGLICGVNKQYMIRYSFILSMPAIIAANISSIKDAHELGQKIAVVPAIVGIITAAVVGIFAIWLIQVLLKKNKFKFFGYYCIGMAAVSFILQVFKLHF